MGATVVGVYTRVAGVWERCNDGTPVGFSGPQTRVAGVWENCVTVETKESNVWKVCWVNIDGELSLGNIDSTDFDLSPYSLYTEVEYQSDGDITYYNFGNNTGTSSWRPYDCGREYEIKFERQAGATADHEPTLNTWLDLTDPATNHDIWDSQVGTGYYAKSGEYLVRIREKVTAPSAGNDSGVYSYEMFAEI